MADSVTPAPAYSAEKRALRSLPANPAAELPSSCWRRHAAFGSRPADTQEFRSQRIAKDIAAPLWRAGAPKS
jgi:hypothetical protein